MVKSLSTKVMNKKEELSVLDRLEDYQRQANRHNRHIESMFLDEEELVVAKKYFPESEGIRYDGGYPNARKQKVIFCRDAEDDFSDIVCLKAEVDTRFRKIEHRDVLGSLMHLQIDRHSFGDFWVDESGIYIYTTKMMGRFLKEYLTRIASLSVSFEEIQEHPSQVFQTKRIEVTIASNRLDAIVASLAHTSRSKAKEMIRSGLVQINHSTLVEDNEVCNNNCTISIRKVGRFVYLGPVRHTRKDRMIAAFLQSI